MLRLSLRLSNVSPCCCRCCCSLAQSLVPCPFLLARGHDGLFPFVRFVRTSLHAHVWIPCSHPRRVRMFRTSTCGGLLSLHAFGWLCCVQWYVLHPTKVGGKDWCPLDVALPPKEWQIPKQTSWGRTFPPFQRKEKVTERTRTGVWESDGIGIDRWVRQDVSMVVERTHPRSIDGNDGKRIPNGKATRQGGKSCPHDPFKSKPEGKKKNHPRDETDTTSVTTGERYKHQRYACDSIVQPECGPMEPSRRKPRIMAFESFPRPTRAIDGPTWACKGPTMRTCNRQKGNEMHTSESQQVLGNEYTMAPRTACTIRANKGIPQQQLKKTT